jgi:hypothetical protein
MERQLKQSEFVLEDFPKLFWDARNNDFSNPEQVRYLSAIASEMAYYEVAADEIGAYRRLKCIPCEDFREILNVGSSTSLRSVVSAGLFVEGQASIETISTSSTKTVIFSFDQHLFISCRGTVPSFSKDWKTNFKKNQIAVVHSLPRAMPCLIHEGFAREAMALLRPLQRKILEKKPKRVFLTGHSLGGAIAALIAYFSISRRSEYPNMLDEPYLMPSKTICFGTPRIGNCEFNNNYSFWQDHDCWEFVSGENDMVPKVPFRSAGYSDLPMQIDAFNRYHLPYDGKIRYLTELGAWVRFLRNTFKDHNIEKYRRDCRLAFDSQHDTRKFCSFGDIQL